jgi:hypothetical protein
MNIRNRILAPPIALCLTLSGCAVTGGINWKGSGQIGVAKNDEGKFQPVAEWTWENSETEIGLDVDWDTVYDLLDPFGLFSFLDPTPGT